MSPYLCGYRKGFNTQYALLSLIGKWKKTLDGKGYTGTMLTDLSKDADTPLCRYIPQMIKRVFVLFLNIINQN